MGESYSVEKPEVHRLWDTLVQCNLHSDYITAQEIYKILSNELSSSIEINEMVLKYKKVELDEAVGNVNYQRVPLIMRECWDFI